MRKISDKISVRLIVYILLIVLQCIFIVTAAADISIYCTVLYKLIRITGIFIIFRIIFSNSHPELKIIWAVVISLFPLISVILYAIAAAKKSHLRNYRKYFPANTSDDSEIMDMLKKRNINAYRISRYISNASGSRIYTNTLTEFYGCGEDFFSDYIGELEKAERFIFIEYFIISKGKMWNRILDILIKKAEAGVDVRIIYDGLGTVNFFSRDYFRKLSKYGIKTAVLSQFIPAIDTLFKSYDHRKITVIDNRTSYTGGLNLADEYINAKQVHGYWKDYAIKMEGSASEGFTAIFLNTWNFCCKSYSEYIPPCSKIYDSDGFIMPFGDVPYKRNAVGKMVYMEIIRNAKSYVYITTPYLVPDDEILSALYFSAESGTDVRIITPHIPDKKYVHAVTRMNYKRLIGAGIRIFEYSEGFIHAKSVVSDDKFAVTGTVNFDFRSFNMLFENSVFMYDSSAVLQIKNDCMKMFDECIEITDEFFTEKSLTKKIIYPILRFFSPLM